MINLPITVPLANTDRLVLRKVDDKKVDKIPPLTDLPEHQADQVAGQRKRRKGQDRRQKHQPNYPLDTRSGGDRRQRRDPDHPPIDTEA